MLNSVRRRFLSVGLSILSVALSVAVLVVGATTANAACPYNSCNTGGCYCVGWCDMVWELDTLYDISCPRCQCTRGDCIRRDGGEEIGCYECCRDTVSYCEETEEFCW